MTEPEVAVLINRLIADETCRLAPVGVDRSVVASDRTVGGLDDRCGFALSQAPPGAGLAIVFLSAETGLARLKRWLVLPLQLSRAARGIAANGGVVMRRYAVFPDLINATIVYELGSPAQRYAETHLIPRPVRVLQRAVRSAIARWSGCDPSVGAIVLLAQKR